MSTTTVSKGQWMAVANASDADRGDLIAVADTPERAEILGLRTGIHPAAMRIVEAGVDRTPRGAQVLGVKWNSLTLYNLQAIDSDGRYRVAGRDQRPLTHDSQPDDYEQRMREYRATGEIAGWVFALPEDGSPEAMERACEAGPLPHEIDWAGLDAAAAQIGEAQ